MNETPTWRDVLDERQRAAVRFAETYVRDFHHGTVGHNDLVLIARMAQLLDQAGHAGATFVKPAREDLPLGFGKYGKQTIREILAHDPDYVDWLARESRDPEIMAAARAVLAAPPVRASAAEESTTEPPF